MRKVRRTAAAAVTSLVLAGAGPAVVDGAAASAATPSSHGTARLAARADLSSYARRVLTLTNQRRRTHGCGALHWNSDLRTAAENHSTLMADDGVLSHVLAGERGLVQRIQHAGYHPWHRIAENAASGYPSPASVTQAWMNSPAHRRNILDCKLHDLGVGVAADRSGALWWTEDFASH